MMDPVGVANVTEDSKTRVNVTIADRRSYFTTENITGSSLIITDVECLGQDNIPPLSSLTSSLLLASQIHDDVAFADNVRAILGDCSGDIMETTWARDDFVFCVAFNEVTQENRVVSAAKKGMHVEVNYLTSDAVPSIVIKALTSEIPDVQDIFKVNQTKSCPVLDFSEYEGAAEDIGDSRRRLLEPQPSSDRKVKWYQKDLSSHPNAKGRRLFTSYDFYVETTTEEYNKFTSFATNVLGCVYFCVPAEFGHDEIPLDQLSTHLVLDRSSQNFRNRRRLQDGASGESAIITLPRRCMLVHGAGVFHEGLEKWRANEYNQGLYTESHNPEYFGSVHRMHPCYCSSMRFTLLDTGRQEWYNEDLQLQTCRNVAMYDRDMDRDPNKPSLNNYGAVKTTLEVDDVATISNTVVITHYTASLTFGAALHKGYCIFDPSSRWATIHTPVGEMARTTISGVDTDSMAILCSRDNIQALIDNFQQYYEEDNDYYNYYYEQDFMQTENMEAFMDTVIPGGKTIRDIFNACTHATETEDVWDWLAELRSHNYPEEVAELYAGAQAQIAQHVSAALCGYGMTGLMKSKLFVNALTQDLLLEGNAVSDGATPLDECLALADLNPGVTFGSSPNDKFYSTASHNTDVASFRDSWVGERAEMKSWVENLRMHEDLGGYNPAPYTYLQCVKDNRSNRIMSEKHNLYTTNGPEACAEQCEGFEYFGLQYGRECWCGNPSNYKVHGTAPESDCDMDCTDGSGIKCGDGDRMSMYLLNPEVAVPTPTPASKPYSHIDCVVDIKRKRLLTEMHKLRSNNGPEACAAKCKGYKFFGLQYGFECWCGNTKRIRKYGVAPSKECNKNCPDGSGKCGGSNRMNAYKYN